MERERMHMDVRVYVRVRVRVPATNWPEEDWPPGIFFLSQADSAGVTWIPGEPIR